VRWFKHMTDASDDEFIAAVESRFGLEGYARWWKLLEAVAKQTKKSNRPEATYSWPRWEAILHGRRKQLREFLSGLVELSGSNGVATGLLGVSNEVARGFVPRIYINDTGELLTVGVPKLLKFRDEYSQKSGQAQESIPSDSGAARDSVRASASPSVSVSVVDHLKEPEEEKQETTSRGTRVPEPFVVTPDMRSWAEENLPGLDVDVATSEFVDFWRAVPGPRGRKLDWPATWRNSLRRSHRMQRLPPARAAPAQRSLTDDQPTRGKYDDYVPPDD